LAVPQPGGGPRRMAPPQQVADGMSCGQQWYPVNQAYPGPSVIHSSDFLPPSRPM
jgi:hypothetical protein